MKLSDVKAERREYQRCEEDPNKYKKPLKEKHIHTKKK